MKGVIYWIPSSEECKKCMKECEGRTTPACVDGGFDSFGGKCMMCAGYKTMEERSKY